MFLIKCSLRVWAVVAYKVPLYQNHLFAAVEKVGNISSECSGHDSLTECCYSTCVNNPVAVSVTELEIVQYSFLLSLYWDQYRSVDNIVLK